MSDGPRVSAKPLRKSPAASLSKFPSKCVSAVCLSTGSRRHTNARTKAEDALGALDPPRALQPLPPIVVRPQETAAGNVPEPRHLRKRPLQLLPRQIQGEVLDLLAGVLEGL